MKSLIRLVAIVFSVVLLSALLPAEAASFGRTTVGTIPSGGLRADFKRGSKFVLSEKGTAYQICAFLSTNGGGTGVQKFRYSLYRDRNGLPAEQVAEADGNVGLAALQFTDWYCLSTGGATPLEPGTYWVMIHTGDNPGIIRYYYDGPANWYGNADTYADGSSDTFGVGGTGEGTISIRVDYYTEAEVRFAGPRAVGTQISGPMSAQMKRGSSFILSEGAQVYSLNAYLDGKGGATGSQPLWLALYDDLNGEPGALVAKAPVPFPNQLSGRTARWVSAPVQELYLVSGRYWIVLHTGAPAGVLRYYSQGTGNWRGNANPGAEPSPFFGAANPGDGTITANILYKPAGVVARTFGPTAPGPFPSGGLSANFIRGSGFDPLTSNPPYTDAWVTGLWAYLDGNGGATGSQKVRLALYDRSDSIDSIHHVVTSDEVTIRAGQPPGWVKFSVPRTRIDFDQFYIMMASSGTQGVARNYASTDQQNWWGTSTSYSSGPPSVMFFENQEFPGATVLQRGTVTVSMHADYVTAP